MTNRRNLQIANILGLLLVLIMNTLAVTIPLGGRTTGEISELYTNLFVPAGYAFSIWSLIYLLLIVFVILQAKGLFSGENVPTYVSQIGGWFFVSCLANAGWIIAWHHLLIPLSVLLMLLILGSLIMVYQRLNVNYFQSDVPFFVRLPFSVYLGWITVATVANFSAFFIYTGWQGFGISEVTWTVIMIAVATLIGLTVLWNKKKDLPFAGVLIWALVAILVKRQTAAAPEEGAIIIALYFTIGLLGVAGLLRLFVNRP